MERAWEVVKKIGGVLLLLEFVVWLIGSAHAGHPLKSSREFGQALDQVTGAVTREVAGGVRWIAPRRQ